MKIQGSQKDFARWSWFRTWFPALFFIVYWLQSFAQYYFGFLINPALSPATTFYLITAMALFIIGYACGLGGPRRVMVVDPCAAYQMNKKYLSKTNWLLLCLSIGVVGLIIGLYINGAGSIDNTLNNTSAVREEITYKMTPITTLAMCFYLPAFMALAFFYFKSSLCGARNLKWQYLVVTGIYLLLCFQSFLSANRGNFFTVITYLAFDIFYVKGVRFWKVVTGLRWLWLRCVLLGFVCVAFAYFFFISRHRGDDGGLKGYGIDYRLRDRYGLYQWFPADEMDISAFFLAASYACTGYDLIELFVKNSDYFAFRPSMLIGGRTLRQINRFLPESCYLRVTASEVGTAWKLQANANLYGWPTIWGWNMPIFGYIGSMVFMLILGILMGNASGTFLRYANVGALLVCFSLYEILMTSYNGWGGDVTHQFAFWLGLIIMCKENRRRSYYRSRGYIR